MLTDHDVATGLYSNSLSVSPSAGLLPGLGLHLTPPHYDEDKPTFQGFLSEDNDEEGSKEFTSTCDEGRKVINAKGK